MGGRGGGGITYCRPTFKHVLKRLCVRIFKEIANSIIAFLGPPGLVPTYVIL